MNDWKDLKAAGDVPPPSPEVLAHARHQLDAVARRRTANRRRLVPVAAAAVAVAAAAVGGIVIRENSSGELPVGTSTLPVPPSTSTPSTSPSTPSTGPGASCVVGYSLAELKKRGFAFDGTVLATSKDPDGFSYWVTFRIHEWFRPHDAIGTSELQVRTYAPPAGQGNQVSLDFPAYGVGSRLLIAGEPQWGGSNPLKAAVAWGCGFSRAYSAADAATWRKILSK
jgi:hypothetical protein